MSLLWSGHFRHVDDAEREESDSSVGLVADNTVELPPVNSYSPSHAWSSGFRLQASISPLPNQSLRSLYSSSPRRFLLLFCGCIMSRWCNLCQQSFPTARGFKTHNSRIHRYPRPRPAQPGKKTYHHHLTGMYTLHAMLVLSDLSF